MLQINKQLLDELSSKAKTSDRLIASYDLRTTSKDTSQRVLSALELGTIVPIYRHNKSAEVVIMLKGTVQLEIYRDKGECVDGKCYRVSSDTYGCNIPVGTWHISRCLEGGTVFLECKDDAYEPLAEWDILKLE